MTTVMTLTGDNEVPESLGDNFDGYMAAYTLTLDEGLLAGDFKATCFGFEEDEFGYFCLGVGANETEDGMYSFHGAGYWEDDGEHEDMEEEYAEEENYDDEYYGEYEDYASEDYYDDYYGEGEGTLVEVGLRRPGCDRDRHNQG